MSTDGGILRRFGALKHGLNQRFVAKQALIVDGIKFEITDKASFTKQLLGDEGDSVLQPAMGLIMQEWMKNLDLKLARLDGFVKDWQDSKARPF